MSKGFIVIEYLLSSREGLRTNRSQRMKEIRDFIVNGPATIRFETEATRLQDEYHACVEHRI